MGLKPSPLAGKILYGILFVIVLPVALWLWADKTNALVSPPALTSAPIGVVLAAIGVVIMLAGMAALYRHGGGLPMSPYPPPRLVTQGAYGILPHPIYLGFTSLCFGIAIATGSSSGLWLVCPTVALCCVALVIGFEKDALKERFGGTLPKPWIHLAKAEEIPADFSDRLSVYILVLLPWLILYEAVQLLGIPKGAFEVSFEFERRWPVLEFSEVFYASVYLVALACPLVARTRNDLRRFSIRALICTGVATICFLVVPIISPTRPFIAETPLGQLLAWERLHDSAAGAFPAFHVIWALLAAEVFARRLPSLKLIWWVWAVVVAASCVTTGMHAIADVAAGIVTYMVAAVHLQIWETIRRLTERIANSWREWRIGSVRIINHGLYAGVGTAIGIAIVGALLGPSHLTSIVITGVLGLVGAGLWAQLVEGSSSLLRPFGYYGSVIGIILGAVLVQWTGTSTWLMLAAFAVAGPWIQIMGRLRCLVQGCCHGRPSAEIIGIRYTHPRSRVTRLSDWANEPLHPTPLYSIVWNVPIGLFMARLWQVHAPLPMIPGIYLILMGAGRFVEEAYRGEPQTAVFAGLRLYQWLAILSILAGAAMTAVPGNIPSPNSEFSMAGVITAMLFGIAAWFALGVDFPNSNRRFSRLV